MTATLIEPPTAPVVAPLAWQQPSRGRDERFRIRRPDDFHVHFRHGDWLRETVPAAAEFFGRALAMPNTVTPIRTGADAVAYAAAIRRDAGGRDFTPLTTIYLTEEHTPEQIREARAAGVVAAKLYPRGVTTNSMHGVADIVSPDMFRLYEAMEDCGMVLCGHFEDPAADILKRELWAIRWVVGIARSFPGLRVVVEHVTTADLIALIEELPATVAGTITAHHLILTLDDIVGVLGLPDPDMPDGDPRLDCGSDFAARGPAIRPHHYCLPVAKRPGDRRDLLRAALWGRKFFFGSDSAPHPRDAKVSSHGCAGIYVPGKVGLGVLAWLFEAHGGGGDWVAELEEFTSGRGARFYVLPPNAGTIALRRSPWSVPWTWGDLVPFAAGQRLPWEPEEA